MLLVSEFMCVHSHQTSSMVVRVQLTPTYYMYTWLMCIMQVYVYTHCYVIHLYVHTRVSEGHIVTSVYTT